MDSTAPPTPGYLPGAVDIRRREHIDRRDIGEAPIIGALPVHVTMLPSPPDLSKRQAQNWAYGRTYDHAMSHAWRYIGVNIRRVLSVQAPGFLSAAQRYTNPYQLEMPGGGHNPLPGPANIIMAPQTTYSDMIAATPSPVLSAMYAKLF